MATGFSISLFPFGSRRYAHLLCADAFGFYLTEFHIAASRLSERADQEIDLTRTRGFEIGGFLVGVRLGVVVVRLRPILGRA